MKIVISRKGSDSGVRSGRMASPILPCGCLCSIPIPYSQSDVRYSDIWFGKRTLQEICSELNSDWKDEFAHLDPDLRFEALVPDMRPEGWRQAFGQSGAAAGHLINQDVGEGDLFIFFGWFRKTKEVNGKLKFDSEDDHGRHIVYGWLDVGRVLEVGRIADGWTLPDDLRFLDSHPHVRFAEYETRPNLVYVNSRSGLGAGLFGTESDGLVLTKPGGVRSQWQLPKGAFESLFLERDLSYHGKEARWDREDEQIGLRVVNRGQEFVLDGQKHAGVYEHFASLIKSASKAAGTCSHDS